MHLYVCIYKKTTHRFIYDRSSCGPYIIILYTTDIIIVSNCCCSRSSDETFVCSTTTILYILLLYFIYVYNAVWFTQSAVRLSCMYIGNIDQHCFHYLFFYTTIFFSIIPVRICAVYVNIEGTYCVQWSIKCRLNVVYTPPSES